jgi:hypothetical protein
VGEDGGCDEDIDVEARRIPREIKAAGGGLTGAGLGVHFTRIETTGKYQGRLIVENPPLTSLLPI